jgi:hypothetical protein
MKELARNDAIGTIHVMPGDKLVGHYTGPDGVSRVVGEYEIKKPLVVNTFVVVEPEPGELGLKAGIGGIFGMRA